MKIDKYKNDFTLFPTYHDKNELLKNTVYKLLITFAGLIILQVFLILALCFV